MIETTSKDLFFISPDAVHYDKKFYFGIKNDIPNIYHA